MLRVRATRAARAAADVDADTPPAGAVPPPRPFVGLCAAGLLDFLVPIPSRECLQVDKHLSL